MAPDATHAEQPIDRSDLDIAYVGGGSRQWAPNLIQDLALSEFDGHVRLYDTNQEAAETNAEFGNWVQDDPDATAEWSYEAVGSLEETLEGADAVILSTQYDPRDTFVHDLRIPKEYGIYGAVAATIGPGGIFRAMRTIPVFRRFAAAIREHCPDAWVFNYTNPVHFVTRALYDEYPDINALGLCHEVLGTRWHLAMLAEEELGMDAERADIEVNVKGINHFTWVDEARCNGVDLWPLLEELKDGERATKRFTYDDLKDESVFTDNWQVTWELFRRFGVLPAAGDRHLIEYATSFIADGQNSLNHWGVRRTDADYRAKHWTPAESKQTTNVEGWMEGEREFELESSGEEFLDILEGLTGDGPYVTNVNLPNSGQVSDIEQGPVVETNAVVRDNQVKPVNAGGFPRPVRSMVQGHVDTIETVIEAARTGDVDRAFQGFSIDDQVQTLTPGESRDLFGELFAAEIEFLDDWNVDDSDVLAKADTFDA
jgi:alpha-galactosidase/6-phospho-beta-glucosidase family protein